MQSKAGRLLTTCSLPHSVPQWRAICCGCAQWRGCVCRLRCTSSIPSSAAHVALMLQARFPKKLKPNVADSKSRSCVPQEQEHEVNPPKSTIPLPLLQHITCKCFNQALPLLATLHPDLQVEIKTVLGCCSMFFFLSPFQFMSLSEKMLQRCK